MSSRFNANVIISSLEEGMGASSLSSQEVRNVEVLHDKCSGKDEVSVKVNGVVVFKYDANLKEDYRWMNHIQEPIIN
jgi:hypothetical protein